MMKKFGSMAISGLMALTMAVSLIPMASAQGNHQAKISETQYRYYTGTFDSATFTKGKNIDEIKKGIRTDNASNNSENGVFNAIIDSYPHIGASTNKAIRIMFPNVEKTKPNGIYSCIQLNPNDSHGNRRTILKPEQAIPIKADDHGYMFHIEMKALEGFSEEDGFCYIDDNDSTKITKHYGRDINVTFQERDYPNGKPVPDPDKDEKLITTAMNMADKNKITFVWTKDVNFTYEEVRLDANGSEVKNDKGEAIYDTKTMNKKKGDTEYALSGGGGVVFPRDFCGYVIIPFSSFDIIGGGWGGKDTDGKINLMCYEMANFYTGFYQQFRGEIWIDDCAFYGPTFANVDGAYNVSIDANNPAARTQSKISLDDQPVSIDDPYGSEDPNNPGGTVSKGEDKSSNEDSQSQENSEESIDKNSSDDISNQEENSIDKPVQNAENTSNNLGLIIGIIVGVVVLIGGGVAAFIIFIKKKAAEEFDFEDNAEDNQDTQDIEDDSNFESKDETENDLEENSDDDENADK